MAEDRGGRTILWRRLDTPGHDACRLREHSDGVEIWGTAVFQHEGAPAVVHYEIACDGEYRTLHGAVHGWTGHRQFRYRIGRKADGVWTLNGAVVLGLESCVDLDYAFTPATNLVQLRRLGLRVGESADVPAAWLTAPGGRLELLPQRYERRSTDTYWYEAPSVGYSGLLEVTATGFTRRYPGLWEMEE